MHYVQCKSHFYRHPNDYNTVTYGIESTLLRLFPFAYLMHKDTPFFDHLPLPFAYLMHKDTPLFDKDFSSGFLGFYGLFWEGASWDGSPVFRP